MTHQPSSPRFAQKFSPTEGTPIKRLDFSHRLSKIFLALCLVSMVAAVAMFLNTPPVRAAPLPPATRTTAPVALPAASIFVTNTNDSGVGSLRQAILLKVLFPGDTIVFSLTLPAVITLSSELAITTSLTITGPGASLLTISGGNTTRVISVTSGITVSFSSLTIADGCCVTDGGGINNAGTLNIANSTFSGNGAGNGGSIQNSGTVNITNTTFFTNGVGAYGGAINNAGGAVYLTNSTLANNLATNGGGGIANQGALFIINTTFYSNTTQGLGGGIYDNGLLDVTNSTFSGNSAGAGGGIADVGGPLTFVRNTIVASSPTGGNCLGAIADGGNNLNYNSPPDGSCPGTGPDPLLGPLQNNGGPTLTMALLAGSPAIDAGNNGSCPLNDQRGFTRPVDGNHDGTATCDIGAYEAPINLFLPLIKK